MKPAPVTTLLGLLVLLTPCVSFLADAKTVQTKSRTITQVVDLLQSMLEKSKEDGKTERELYAKYKCYCDTNTEEKTAEIATLTEQIDILESKIEELQSSTGTLSEEVAKLKADMTSNQQSQDEATTLREKRQGDYEALKSDLTQAIGQMGDAITTLSAIGADQTMKESAEDSKYMMAGYGDASLLSKKLKTSVKAALVAASAFVSPAHLKQTQVLESFIQAPFTGTYTAQSGEVVGILKDMRDTFKANLAAATETNDKEIEAYDKLMDSLKAAMTEMMASFQNKQELLGGNDLELKTKKTQLETAVEDKEKAEEFLATLTDMCTKKAAEYKQRTMLRANEDAAIAEAISILNSDAAFATFGTVDATSTGGGKVISLVQVRAHRQLSPKVEARQVVQKFLASKPQTGRIIKVEAMLQAENPFQTVLDEIKKMLGLIAKEEKEDKEQFEWCEKEQTEHNGIVDAKTEQINTLIGEIDELEETINHPVTGLLVQISGAETDLEENQADQKTETKERTEDNLAYQKDIANLQEANTLLTKAIKVLKDYYATIMKESLVQKSTKQSPPETWEGGADQSSGAFAGQSAKGGDAISMLEFILSETEKEEQAAHSAEEGAQHDFEDSMTSLTTSEKELLESIARLKGELAQAEEDLMLAKKDLKASKEVKAASLAYLKKIERGCTWIQKNIEMRSEARVAEKEALTTAVTTIEGTPAYKQAVQAQKEEDFGDCKETCVANESHAECQACLAKTSVPGYCAGHKDTPGC